MKIDKVLDLVDFDLNLLVVMDALWSARSVSRAARRLKRSQSTLSAALSRLREQLGDEVFVWNGHEMKPTPLAEQLMPQVGELLASARALVRQAHGGLAQVKRRLVIATSSYVTTLFGPALIARLRAEAPGLSLDFIATNPSLTNRSNLPDIDLFIVPLSAARTNGMQHQSLYSDEYVCIGHVENAALYEDMPLDDFLALPHVGFSNMPRVIASHEASFWGASGIEPDYVILSPEYLTLPRLVAQGGAVAIVPGMMARFAQQQYPLKAVKPPTPVPPIEIGMIWKPSQADDPTHRWLRETLAALGAELERAPAP
jgi:DNA-binding transcriptional LysR family regulator